MRSGIAIQCDNMLRESGPWMDDGSACPLLEAYVYAKA